MSASALYVLVESSIAASAAVLLVALMRKPLRRLAGPAVACWLWLLVPASTLVILLPVPPQAIRIASQFSEGAFAVTHSSANAGTTTHYAAAAFMVWLSGCFVMMTLMAGRQRAFVRSLSSMTRAADGTYRSVCVSGPLLIGIWRPRIILPADFDTRYSARERASILAHEQAHLERRDVLTTTIGVMWLCALWFNPLMYWAIARFRFDQELACDAIVLARSQAGRRHYAHTLLKAQLAADSPWRIPISCHWLSTHPLKERIAMLKRPSPGSTRRLLGIVLTSASILAGSSLVWATQSEPAHIAQVQKDDLPIQFLADRIAKLTNGDVTLSGNVSFTPKGVTASNLSFEADRVIQMDEHSVLLEGAVRISAGRYVLRMDRAILAKDGLVTTDSALLSPTSETH
jgi:bla regulator protein blaR1